jgi:acylphosphatase
VNKRHAHTAERCVKVKTLKQHKTSNLLLGKAKNVKTRAHVFVTGRVQGVFFRSTTKHNADRYDVKGWVRNLPDNRLEAVFEGEKEAVQTLIDFCKHGPSGAKVTNIDLTLETYTGDFDRFKIKYG